MREPALVAQGIERRPPEPDAQVRFLPRALSPSPMRVTVVGTGYVGLVTGACLAHLGHRVVCLDTDDEKIRSLRAGHVPIYEPELDDLVSRETGAGRLSFDTDYPASLQAVDAVFICVGTPSL